MGLFGRHLALNYIQSGKADIIRCAGFCGRRGLGSTIRTLVLGQPLLVNTLITTIFAQVSTFAVLVKVLHNLFKVFLRFHFQ